MPVWPAFVSTPRARRGGFAFPVAASGGAMIYPIPVPVTGKNPAGMPGRWLLCQSREKDLLGRYAAEQRPHRSGLGAEAGRGRRGF